MNVLDEVRVSWTQSGKLYITTNKECLDDLVATLEALFRLSKRIRMKAVTARGDAAIYSKEQERKKQIKAARKEETRIYRVYMSHLNNGCAGNVIKAIEETGRELQIGIRDVKRVLHSHDVVTDALSSQVQHIAS